MEVVDKDNSLMRLRNILLFMKKNDYHNPKYYRRVIEVYNNIFDNGLTESNQTDFNEVVDYFMNEVYPISTSLDKGLARVWSKNRNAFRGM